MKNGICQVMLVEDHAADADLVRILLERTWSGTFDLQTVATLSEALQAAELQEFDAVLLDLSLPDSRGVETVQRFRAAWPGLPVIVLTGADDEKLGPQTLKEGAQDYLLKNFHSIGEILARSILYSIKTKTYEKSLGEARQNYRRLANLLPDPVLNIREDFTVTYANKGAGRLCRKVEPDDRFDLRVFFHPMSISGAEDLLKKAWSRTLSVKEATLSLRCQDDQYHEREVVVSSLLHGPETEAELLIRLPSDPPSGPII